jgi:ADP-ribosyl-[dinitrogen reductase] hydrolase
MVTLASRLAGAAWGHLVGDAMGVPYEFRSAAEIEASGIVFGARGTHDQPPGTWSDDGALMLALLDSLLEVGFDTTDQAARALAWYRAGRYAAGGTVFDIGNTTRTALERIADGVPAEDAGPSHERSAGNGSLMRILPLALVERDTPIQQLVDYAHRSSRVTHGHPSAQVACALYVLTALRLLAGSEPTDALATARADLRAIYEVADFGADFLRALDHLEAWPEREGRGRVWDSLWSAWDAFAGADSYSDAVRRSIAYGNDTDTTAAIAGGLAGIRWGLEGIPRDWLAAMRERELVTALLSKLAARSTRL